MLRHHDRCYGTAPDGRLFRGTPRGTAQRKQLRPHLACCPRPGPRARSGCHRSCPPPIRPAPRRAVAMAERRRRTRPDRATSRPQHHRATRRLLPLHRRPGRHHQPANRGCPPRRNPVTLRDSKRFREPPVPPRSCPPYVRAWPTLACPRGRVPAARKCGQNPQLRSQMTVSAAQRTPEGQQRASRAGLLNLPDLAHVWPTTPASGLRNRLLPAIEPLTQVRVNGSDLGRRVAGVGFEPT